MADDVWNAASRGDAAEVRRLIDRGGDVHFKDVRLAFAARPRPPRRRVRALRPKEPASSAQRNTK